MVKVRTFEVVAGSYEGFLLGYNFSTKENGLKQSFAVRNHSESIRCVTVSGQYVASGGADDRIIVYDMKTRTEHNCLIQHNGTVNCLQFTNNHSHLLSGGADGMLAIVRVGSWQLEKVWEKAHKGAAILDIAVHSTGKLALTLGNDCSLCTWNLVKGRQAYIINLSSKSKDARSLEKIVWADDDVRFVLYGGKYTEIWSIESGGILQSIEHQEKVNSCLWLSDTQLLTGHEDGQLCIVDVEDQSKVFYKAHDSRVKSLALHEQWIVSVSSSGEIKVWDKNFEEIAKKNTGCRLTSLCVVPVLKVMKEETVTEAEVTEECGAETERAQAVRSKVIETVEDSDEERIKQKAGHSKKKKRRQMQERTEVLEEKTTIEDGDEEGTEQKTAHNKKKRRQQMQERTGSIEEKTRRKKCKVKK